VNWMLSKARLAAACGLLGLFGPALGVQAAGPAVRPPAVGARKLTNATVVAVDAEAGKLIVRGGGIGEERTLTVAPEAQRDLRQVKAGDEVVIVVDATARGAEVVRRVERSPADTSAARSTPGRASRVPADPIPISAPALSLPSPSPSNPPASPSPGTTTVGSLPTDTVGPLRDPRVNPHFDPRVNPHRDPRVVPGLSAPGPSPTPTPKS
jgi:hypothetical protein